MPTAAFPTVLFDLFEPGTFFKYFLFSWDGSNRTLCVALLRMFDRNGFLLAL